MQTRVPSAVVVVLVGLLPALIGGPVFALVVIALGAAGFREYLALVTRIDPYETDSVQAIGYGVVAAFGLVALVARNEVFLFVICAIGIAAPLVLSSWQSAQEGGVVHWSLSSAGSLYLGLPVYAAVALRSMPGEVDAGWLGDVIAPRSFGWDPAPRGLAWTLLVILATWIGDTVAYLSGRTFGQRKLAPTLSPNKTIEGAAGGLIASAAFGALAFPGFGLGSWWLGLLVGGIIGLAGQLGDLAESFLKRQAGVKDSGSLIPGHGGVLDRIDALFFAFPTGFALAASLDWLMIS